MSFWTQLSIWITKIFWPWFLKFAWPFIKEHLVEVISFMFQDLKEKIKEFMSQKSGQNEEKAKQQAVDAENKATKAKSDHEREKWEAISNVWREVAENFRSENEGLKTRIDELVNESVKEASKSISELDLSLDLSENNTLLTIGDKSKQLPAPKQNKTDNDK